MSDLGMEKPRLNNLGGRSSASSNRKPGDRNTENQSLIRFVEEWAALCQPERIYWCDGSVSERKALTEEAVRTGVLIELNQQKLPGCYYHRSNLNDVARVERLTFICTESQEEAGPTNNWAAPKEMERKLRDLLDAAMRGRTMYVLPYLMGPPGSPLSKVGVELTDSIYVCLSMGIMTRMGDVALEHLGDSDDFNHGIHSMLDVSPDRRYIAHFPRENKIISVGSNYGGNVLLGKKCLALRIGSYLARSENWLAEHMLILGVESPTGETTYIAAAFPSGCGKTNFSMMIPPPLFAGWKVRTVGDDIAWMKPGADGRLYAINPEAGYFGVVPGTNSESNPNAVAMMQRDTIFTNVALTNDLDVWWEGKDGLVPEECWNWKGERWTPESSEPAAHPNSRFTTPAVNNPMFAPEANDPKGVPISAIIFGGRRKDTLPLVFQSFDWGHGVYLGAMMGSEMTAAAAGGSGQLRRDPMAMLPFCGYDMGHYFRHWLKMRKQIGFLPRIFQVNWFRKSSDGKYLWPGFSENMRVLKWIIDRCHGRVRAKETILGWMPYAEEFDCEGLKSFGRKEFEKIQAISADEWKQEITLQDELFLNLYHTMPKELTFQRELLMSRL
jgi:phosphoenolpyruvate carboxykinase (GTP)